MVELADGVAVFAHEMRRARLAGVALEDAYPAALAAALNVTPDQLRSPVRRALGGTREAWRRAYEGQPPTRRDLSVVRLAVMDMIAERPRTTAGPLGGM